MIESELEKAKQLVEQNQKERRENAVKMLENFLKENGISLQIENRLVGNMLQSAIVINLV